MPGWIDITGQTINGWKALEYVGKELWKVVCPKCGDVLLKKSAELRYLKTGHCKKCQMAAGSFKTTHGHSKGHKPTKTFKAWDSMRYRCNKPTRPSYSLYGGRGIKVCDRWSASFSNFLEDMGEAPAGMSLDRINNNGNYEPGNCRWATSREQGNNTRVCRWVEFEGAKMTIAMLARKVGTQPNSITRMLKNIGWPKDTVPTLKLISTNTQKPRLIPC